MKGIIWWVCNCSMADDSLCSFETLVFAGHACWSRQQALTLPFKYMLCCLLGMRHGTVA